MVFQVFLRNYLNVYLIKLKQWKYYFYISTYVLFGSSLQCWQKIQDVFAYLSLYPVRKYIGITTSKYFALSTCVL